MAVEQGPKLELVEATETTIVVEFQPLPSVSVYELQWSEVPQFWNGDIQSTRITTIGDSSQKQKAEATNLNPGSTFALRLACVQNNNDDDNNNVGAPGPELIIDTEQVGCTPKPDKGCCILL